MKVILTLCLIALISGSFATSKLEEPKYVHALKGLFQIATADEFEEVQEILDQVRHQIEGLLGSTQEAYENAAEVHEAEHDAAVETLQGYANTIQELEAQVDEAEEIVERLQENIDSALDAIEEARSSQAAEEARRVQVHGSFKDMYHNLQAAIEDVEDALRLLQEIDDQDLSGSFLEINSKKISHKFEALHKAVHHLQLNHLSPMTELLLEITDSGLDHHAISQIVDLVTQLLEDLRNELNTKVAQDNADDTFSRAVLANLQDTIDTESQSAETSQVELDGYVAIIEWCEDHIEYLSRCFERDHDIFEFNEEAWSNTSDNYKALIRRLKRDIEAVIAAEKFVDRD